MNEAIEALSHSVMNFLKVPLHSICTNGLTSFRAFGECRPVSRFFCITQSLRKLLAKSRALALSVCMGEAVHVACSMRARVLAVVLYLACLFVIEPSDSPE
jgi:hypothetical protein